MRDYKAIMDAVLERIKGNCSFDAVAGPLPPNGGLALIASGGSEEKYMDGSGLLKLPITMYAKAKTQSAALAMLAEAHTVVEWYAKRGKTWQMTGVSIKRPPMLMGQDSAGYWIYNSVIEVRAYIHPEVTENG